MRSYQPEEKEKPSLKCGAWGCSRPGALHNAGSKQGYCQDHFNMPVDKFDEICIRQRKAEPIDKHIQALRLNPFEPHLYEYPRNPEFNKLPEENPYQYAYRLQTCRHRS